MSEVNIYVLPTEENMPPRAAIGEVTESGMVGIVATWNRDLGAWAINGSPVDQELGEAITEHAKELGVEW